MKLKLMTIVCSIIPIGLFVACVALQTDLSAPRLHPDQEGEELKMCTSCHETSAETIVYERFNHTIRFAEDHGQVARQQGAFCNMCHSQSDCDACHGVWVELKPSSKNPTENYRRMPHRGDYISRHIIDARINPAPCYRCHGNFETAMSCRPCHG